MPRVVSHETGHAIDELAGGIDTSGLSRELEQVYSDLATGQQGRARHKTRPKELGYSPSEAPREMMAEAIRAYMVDPNYLKTVAPKTAERIRLAVNENPRIANTIQFNLEAQPMPVMTDAAPERPAEGAPRWQSAPLAEPAARSMIEELSLRDRLPSSEQVLAFERDARRQAGRARPAGDALVQPRS